jgi:hypothetical protein
LQPGCHGTAYQWSQVEADLFWMPTAAAKHTTPDSSAASTKTAIGSQQHFRVLSREFVWHQSEPKTSQAFGRASRSQQYGITVKIEELPLTLGEASDVNVLSVSTSGLSH